MTSKEKAAELIVNYQLKCKSLYYEEAKQCAIIAVDEIMLAIPDASDDDSPYNHELKYWQQVKHELENFKSE